MKEIWRDIKGYEGLYKVSSCGLIYSRITNKNRALCKDSYGYENVGLFKNKKGYQYLVHRIVAKEFIPNPESKRTVNHKNGIKHDNRVENLEWATHKENYEHAVRMGLQTPLERKNVKLTVRDVLEIRKLYKTGNFKQSELVKIFNVNKDIIHLAVRHKTWKNI